MAELEESLSATGTAISPRPLSISRTLGGLMIVAAVAFQGRSVGEQVAVRHMEGLVHGFLALRTLEGTALADGDWIQTAQGTRVTSRLVFHFKDGSLHDETAVFSQRQQFRLVNDHLVQRGPSFPRPLDLSINATSGDVTVRYTDDHGKENTESEHLDLPPDLANGM